MQVGGKGRRAGARRKGDEPRFENAAEERGKRDTDHIFDQRAVTDDDVQDGRDGRDEDELAERQEHLEAMLADGVGNEAEHADGGIHHDHVGHADHHVADEFKNTEQRFARFAEGAQGKAENNGKEDDLQHVALGEGIYGVHRHDVEQGLDQAGRRDLLCLQAFCGKIQPNAGLHDVGEEQTDGHGHARGEEVVDERFGGDAPQFAQVMDARGPCNNRGKDQRHDHHADQGDEKLPERAQVGGGKLGGSHAPDDDAKDKPDDHLHRKAHFGMFL